MFLPVKIETICVINTNCVDYYGSVFFFLMCVLLPLSLKFLIILGENIVLNYIHPLRTTSILCKTFNSFKNYNNYFSVLYKLLPCFSFLFFLLLDKNIKLKIIFMVPVAVLCPTVLVGNIYLT